jgi:CHAD domain-containing protein
VTTIEEYAHRQISGLLRKLVYELHRVPTTQDKDAVHDLRVATRRFLYVSRFLRQFLPAKALKPIRRRLRRLLDLTSNIRELDIALEMAADAGIDAESKLGQSLSEERRKAHQHMIRALGRWNRKDIAMRWRADLELIDQ